MSSLITTEDANNLNLTNNPRKLPKLGARLLAVYTQVLKLAKDGDIIADIGTDHGFLAVHLAASGKFKKVIASDISYPSLNKAKQLSDSLNLTVECNLGDGLLAVPECTIAAICGMGGWEIIKILGQPTKADRFVLVAMQNPVQLRQYLLNNNFTILTDYLVTEHKKFYFVMSVVKNLNSIGLDNKKQDKDIKHITASKYDQFNLYFGLNFDAKSRLGRLYLQNQINNLNFLQGFDTLAALSDSTVAEKYYYYMLCKKLLQEGHDDSGHN